MRLVARAASFAFKRRMHIISLQFLLHVLMTVEAQVRLVLEELRLGARRRSGMALTALPLGGRMK